MLPASIPAWLKPRLSITCSTGARNLSEISRESLVRDVEQPLKHLSAAAE